MIKFKYTVKKAFSIFKDEDTRKERLAKTKEEEKHSSYFAKGAQYVDYRFSTKDIEQCWLTHELEEKGYISLDKKLES